MNIKNFLKGIIIGVAKIIPGLSGAVLMISFNLYDKAICAITNFFDDVKGNFLFLFNLGLGIGLGIVGFSRVLSYFIVNYYVYTTSLFVGLILGGIPVLLGNIEHKKRDYLIIGLSFAIMTLISFISGDNSYAIRHNAVDLLVYFIAGILEAVGTVLPGISSTALLMLMGIYNTFLSTLANIFDFSVLGSTLFFLLPFSMGLFIGIIILSLVVNFMFKYYKSLSFAFIIGVTLSSVFLLIVRVFQGGISILEGVICTIFVIFGYFITKGM